MQEVLDPVLRNLAFGEKNAITLFPEGGAYNFFIGAVSAGVMNSVSYTSGAIADRKNVNYDITLPSGTVVTADAINNVMNARESDADRLLLAKLGEEMTPELLEREVSKIQSRANVDMGGRTYGDVMKEAAGLETSAERIDLYSDIINSEEYAASVEAYKQRPVQEKETPKYDIKMDKFGNRYWHIETHKDIFSGITDTKELQKRAYDYILHGDKGEQVKSIINGEELLFTRISAREYLYGTQSKGLQRDEYNQKMRLAPSVLDLIENADNSFMMKDMKNHNFAKDGFLNYKGRTRIDDVIFKYIVRVGKSEKGNLFYDVNLEVDSKVPDAKGASLIKQSTSKGNKILLQQSENVKQKDSFEKGKDVIRHLTAARMAAEYGLQVKIIDNPNKDVHGYVSGDTVYLNRNSDKSILVTMVHELTHKTENTKFYKEIHTAAINWMHQTGVDMSAFRNSIAETYAENGIELSDSGIDYEITAKFIADVVFGTEAEVFNFVHRNQSLAQKIKGWIDTLLGRNPEDVNLKIAKRNFEKALREVRRQTGTDNADVQYYIAKDDKGNDISVIEQNIFAGKKGIPQHIVVADHIREHIGEVYSIMQDASAVYLGADLPGEYTQSKYTQVLKKAKDSRIRGKNQAVQNLGELIEIGRNMRWEANKKPKHKQDAKYGWYRYDTSFAVPVRDIKQNLLHYNAFDATLLIRHNADGKKYLYDLIDIKKRGKPLTSTLLQRSVTVGNQMITSATSFRST
ncbi:MAG: hypothetical protein ACOXZ0_06315, partial [Eubacteriales bacterium]